MSAFGHASVTEEGSTRPRRAGRFASYSAPACEHGAGRSAASEQDFSAITAVHPRRPELPVTTASAARRAEDSYLPVSASQSRAPRNVLNFYSSENSQSDHTQRASQNVPTLCRVPIHAIRVAWLTYLYSYSPGFRGNVSLECAALSSSRERPETRVRSFRSAASHCRRRPVR